MVGWARLKAATCLMLVACLTLLGSPAAAQSADHWTGKDKALHVAVAAGLAAGAYAGAAWVRHDRTPRIVIGLSVGIGASAAKEWRDRHTGGDPSWKDFTAGVIGAGAGTAVAWLIDRASTRPPAPSPGADTTPEAR